jgi:hypothetical protein
VALEATPDAVSQAGTGVAAPLEIVLPPPKLCHMGWIKCGPRRYQLRTVPEENIVVVIVIVNDRSVVLVVETVVRLVVRLVVTRGVVVVALGVVEGRVTGLLVRAFIVTRKWRGIDGVVVRIVVFCVVVFGVVRRLVVRLVTGGSVVVLTVVRLVVEVDVLRLGVEEGVTS